MIAVVLLQMGGPGSLEEVEPFLYNLFSDNDLIPLPLGFLWQKRFARLISHRRARKVVEYYRYMGGKSPIGEITRAQADALEARLNQKQPGKFKVYVAMRYTPPFTIDVIKQIRADGATHILALSLYPHYTTATTGSSLWELRKQLAGKPPAAGGIGYQEIDRWYNHPGYLDALTEQVSAGYRQFPESVWSEVQLVFSAHGLPQSFILRGEPYVNHLLTTIAGVLSRLAHQPEWHLAFQSRAGPTRWLEPATDEFLRELAGQGKKRVLIVPISFVSDHVETLYEIDVQFAEEAQKLGLEFKRAPSLNVEPKFIEALAHLVEERINAGE